MKYAIDETELARLEALAGKAKPGAFAEKNLFNSLHVDGYGNDNAAYIAAISKIGPALVAEVRRLREEVKQGGIDYCALMDRHDAQFVRAEKLSGEVNWLTEVCATHCRDKSFDNAQCSIHDCAPIHCYHASAEQWKEAAREAANADRE